jgi:hypothetical protein
MWGGREGRVAGGALENDDGPKPVECEFRVGRGPAFGPFVDTTRMCQSSSLLVRAGG